jgi:hypothetical protein
MSVRDVVSFQSEVQIVNHHSVINLGQVHVRRYQEAASVVQGSAETGGTMTEILSEAV